MEFTHIGFVESKIWVANDLSAFFAHNDIVFFASERNNGGNPVRIGLLQTNP